MTIPPHDINNLFEIISRVIEDVMHYHHLDSILDKIIFEARQLTNADAGSIYLADNNSLRFGYVHNDTFFSIGFNKFLYSNHRINIDDQSIAGYAGLSGKPLLIEDAYAIPGHMPCMFNKSFDSYTGYKTKSMLTVPIITSRNIFVGVLQLINAMDPDKNIVAFTDNDLVFISHLASRVGAIIERAFSTNEYCLKLLSPSGNGRKTLAFRRRL
jgi:GAF domain-containing protein